MSTFDQAYAFTLGIEKNVITADPQDPGGLTNAGISQVANPDLDVTSLTDDQKRQTYKERYWDKVHGDELPPALAVALFDTAVNQGPGTAVKILQETIGLKPDGLIGPVTIRVAQTGVEAVLKEFFVLRTISYTTDLQFYRLGHGWTRRAFDCYDFAKTFLKGNV
jgi:lysozyme family protein